MKLFVYDSEMRRVGFAERDIIHHNGSWHRGAQLNIICGDKLLIQQRSGTVDIAKGLFDQSLATQLTVDDSENELRALHRGLEEELGLRELNGISRIAGPIKIVKRYKYDKSLFNNEFISLYEVKISEQLTITPASRKVNSVEWVPLNIIKLMATQHPERFTKTFLMWLMEYM